MFLIKITAWYVTGSVAILTDALESTVNVITGIFGLYSLTLSAKPRDEEHPYGHGKIEFISAAVEGILIFVAGILIVIESVINLKKPHDIGSLETGIWLISGSAVVNLVVGYLTLQKGKQNKSLPLVASGQHLLSDTWSTLGIIAGLILLKFTGLVWVDSVTALVFSLLIMWNGYQIIRKSVAGIMDERDNELLEDMVTYLNSNRRDNWVDLHNLRVIKYGSVLHLDCHVTVPWYLNVHEAHTEVDALDQLIRSRYGDSIEMFVHTDGCLPFSCTICSVKDCMHRSAPCMQRIEWHVNNISTNLKHRAEEGRSV